MLDTSDVSCMARALQVNYRDNSTLFHWKICDSMYKKMLENCTKTTMFVKKDC
jgi:hypothetical protein